MGIVPRVYTEFKNSKGKVDRIERAVPLSVGNGAVVDADSTAAKAEVLVRVVLTPPFIYSVVFQPVDKSKPLKARVHVTVDPPVVSLPRQHVYYGVNGFATGLPERFESSIAVGDEAAKRFSDIFVDTTTTKPRGGFAVEGGLFDGAANDRSRTLGGSVLYQAPNATTKQRPLPTKTKLQLKLGDVAAGERLIVAHESDARSSMHASFVDAEKKTFGSAQLHGIPKVIAFAVSKAATGFEAAYQGKGKLDFISARVQRDAPKLSAAIRLAKVGSVVTASENDGVITANASSPLDDVMLKFNDAGLPDYGRNFKGSAAVVRTTPAGTYAYARLRGVKTVRFLPSPLTFSLRTDRKQDVQLAGNIEDKGEPFPEVAGRIRGLPAEVDVNEVGGGIQYIASARAKEFNAHASQLPAIPAEPGAPPPPTRAHVIANDVPEHWRVDYGKGQDKRLGIAPVPNKPATKGFGQLQVYVTNGGSNQDLKSDRNSISVDRRADANNLNVGIRMHDLRAASFVPNLDPADIASPLEARLDFSAGNPKRLEILALLNDLVGSPTSEAKLVVPKPPAGLTTTVQTAKTTNIVVQPSSPIAKASLELTRPDFRFKGEARDIGTSMRLCLAGNFGCGRLDDTKAQSDFDIPGTGLFKLATKLSVSLSNEHPDKKTLKIPKFNLCQAPIVVKASGKNRICTVQGAPRVLFGMKGFATRSLSFSTGSMELCTIGGSSIDDGLVSLTLHTDSRGVKITKADVLGISTGAKRCDGYPKADGKSVSGIGVLMPDPVTANRYATIVDSDHLPPESEYIHGDINCPGSFDIRIRKEIANLFDASQFLDGC